MCDQPFYPAADAGERTLSGCEAEDGGGPEYER